MADSSSEYLQVAEEAARIGGAILVESFGRVGYREKGPGDLVTEADRASQRAIAAFLSERFPGHTLLAEEDGVRPDPARPWRWIVDPLDGTTNYAHGLPLWAVSIALEHAGSLVAGVVHLPAIGRTYSAGAGLGARLNGEPIAVSRAGRLADSLVGVGLPTGFAADADRQMAYLGRFSVETHAIRRTGTTAWNLALVAAGAFEVAYATTVYPWDVAAGVLLVREAGGLLTGLDGSPYDHYQPGFLATNGAVHAESLAAIAGAWPIEVSAAGRPVVK